MIKTKHLLLLATIPLGITFLIGLFLSSSYTHADGTDVVDQVNITVPVSCSLSGTGMNTHNAEINNGQYNSAIGETTIKAFCNDNNGFAIYAIGYTDDTDGKNVLTSSTLGSTYDIVTGTATSGATSNWAMKLSTVSSPTPTYPLTIQNSFDSFQEVPDDYTLVAKRTSGTDIGTSAEGSALKSTYQAYISPTQPAGTYTGQVKYTLIYPHDETAPSSRVSFEDAFSSQGKTKLSGYYKMQDFSSSICNLVSLYDEASQTQLIDSRDNKVYWVAKMQDDRCWMTQNLDLRIVYGDTFTNEDTDIGWNQATHSYDTASITADGMESNELGDYVWNGTIGSSGTKSRSAIADENELHYHLGDYYSWDSAVASNDPTPQESSDESPDQSICPVNWTLPSQSEYDNLFSAYFDEYAQYYQISEQDDLADLMGSPIYLIPAGSNDGVMNMGTTGWYWTKDVYGISEYSFAVDLALNYDYLYITDGDRYNGGSVRCVAR